MAPPNVLLICADHFPGPLLGAMGQAAQAGEMTQSDSQDMGTCYTALFTEMGDRVVPD